MNTYQFYKSIGVCPICHQRKPAPGHAYCQQCLDKKKKYSKKHKTTYFSNLSEEGKQRNLDVQRIRYQKHKANGICVCCKQKATHGVFCEKHARIKRETQLRIARKRGAKPMRDGKKLPVPKTEKQVKTDLGKLIALYNAGWTYRNIAREMRISQSTVSYWVKKAKDQVKEEELK